MMREVFGPRCPVLYPAMPPTPLPLAQSAQAPWYRTSSVIDVLNRPRGNLRIASRVASRDVSRMWRANSSIESSSNSRIMSARRAAPTSLQAIRV